MKENSFIYVKRSFIQKIATSDNLFDKKTTAKEIFGSNLALERKKVSTDGLKNDTNWGQTQWAALAAAQKEIGKMSDCMILVRLYTIARTYFIKNS